MPTIIRNVPIGGMLAALAIWFTGMTAAVFVVPPQTIVAFGAPKQLIQAAAEADASIVGATGRTLTLRPGASDTVQRLYRGGAWLVWPALKAGCIGRTPAT